MCHTTLVGIYVIYAKVGEGANGEVQCKSDVAVQLLGNAPLIRGPMRPPKRPMQTDLTTSNNVQLFWGVVEPKSELVRSSNGFAIGQGC